jgi:RNA polymerase sigma-B factor
LAAVERLGAPTVPELASELGESPDDVLEALAARATRATAVVFDDETAAATPAARAGDALAAIDDDMVLADLLGRLDPTDRHIVELSFITGLTQREVAATVGVSQMQVSRVLRRSIDRLRHLST